MSENGTRPSTEAETRLLRENTRLRNEVEQARDDGASMARENLNAARAEADELRRLNTPLRARVAALEKQLSRAEQTIGDALFHVGLTHGRAIAAGVDECSTTRCCELGVLIARMESMVEKPAVTGTTSDNTSFRPLDHSHAAHFHGPDGAVNWMRCPICGFCEADGSPPRPERDPLDESHMDYRVGERERLRAGGSAQDPAASMAPLEIATLTLKEIESPQPVMLHADPAALAHWCRSAARLALVKMGLWPAPCPVPSSITGAACTLPEGHPPDSPTRFHRYPPVVTDGPLEGAARDHEGTYVTGKPQGSG